MSASAERAHVGSEHLHKALASGAQPRYYTVLLNSHGSSPVGSPIKESRDAEFWSQPAR